MMWQLWPLLQRKNPGKCFTIKIVDAIKELAATPHIRTVKSVLRASTTCKVPSLQKLPVESFLRVFLLTSLHWPGAPP